MDATSEANAALVVAFVDAWNRGDWDAIFGAMAEDIHYHNIPWEPMAGLDAVRAYLLGSGIEASDWTIHAIVANGSVVMTERTDRVRIGGRWIAVRLMGVFEISGGRIAAWRDYFDPAEFASGD